jgi:hypothetical protein
MLKSKEGEAKTEVVFFFEKHQMTYLKSLKESVERVKPNIIVVEHTHEEIFDMMIKNSISVKEYMGITRYSHTAPEFSKNKYELLREFHKKGVKIKTVAAEETDNTRRELTELRRIAERNMNLYAMVGDFGGMVSAGMDMARALGSEGALRDIKRSAELAGKIKSGEWRGTIMVELGMAHTACKNMLIEQLRDRDDVTVSSLHPFKDVASEMFHTAESVYAPGLELSRIFGQEATIGGEICSRDRKRLLAARDIIYSLTYDEKTESREGERWDYERIKMVNKLSYDDCRGLCEEILKTDMGAEKASQLVKDYLKSERKKK